MRAGVAFLPSSSTFSEVTATFLVDDFASFLATFTAFLFSFILIRVINHGA